MLARSQQTYEQKNHICLVISLGIPTKRFLSNHTKDIHTKVLGKKKLLNIIINLLLQSGDSHAVFLLVWPGCQLQVLSENQFFQDFNLNTFF